MSVKISDNKKILFVILDYENVVISKRDKSLVLPYGVLSLASYIEYCCPNVETKIIDFNILNYDEQIKKLKEEIEQFKPDIAGISVMYNSCFLQIAPICKIVKDFNTNILTIAGGILATNLQEDVLNSSKYLDAICFSEGEIPLVDLISSDDYTETIKNHKSLLSLEDYKNGKRGIASFVDNLDDIPIINYQKIDPTKYLTRLELGGKNKKKYLSMHSTRGCPFNCIFCCASSIHGKKIRYMSTERFLSDVDYYVKNYNINSIDIDDDQFLFKTERAKNILKGLAKYNLEISFASGLNVKYIDDEISLLLKNVGLKIAVLAIESGSEKVLHDIIDKPLTITQIKPAIIALKKVGLLVHAFFIVGFPNETHEDREMTRQLIKETEIDWSNIFIASPFKGSRLYDVCVQNGYITPLDMDNPNIYEGIINAPGVNPKEITEYAYLLNLDVNFVKNPNYKNGKFELAFSYFNKIALKYPEHAFAHYYSAKCLEKMNRDEESNIINSDKKWYEYSQYFEIESPPTPQI